MKKFIFSLLILIVCAFGSAAQTKTSGELPAEIVQMNGADSMELLNNPTIKSRLKKLLGAKNYASFLDSFETVAPVEKNGSFLFSSGCLIHACTNLESAIAVDLTDKTIHAAIYDRTRKTKFFNEKNRKTPEVIKSWANRLEALKNDRPK